MKIELDPYKRISIEQGDKKIMLDGRRFLKHFTQIEDCFDFLLNNPYPEMRFGYYGVRMEVRNDDDGCPEVIIKKGNEFIKIDFMEFDELRKTVRDLDVE
jgi:hypothetical protein